MGKVLYIDPNPEGLDLINHEDLSIFVELVTTKKMRSDINVDAAQKSVNINSGGQKIPVKFLSGSDIDGDGNTELTTHYTEINTKFNDDNPDLESFGITSIDIKFDTAYTPIIKINFTDVKGKLFEMGNESPYNIFFNLPYPIFELTIKGYYGKAVKYCLHLQKFTGKLNDKTGNFEIQCDFVGYTYAFLSDMLMGYLRGIAETPIAKEKIEESKRKFADKGEAFFSLGELNSKITNLNNEIIRLKSDDDEVAKISLAENSVIEIDSFKKSIIGTLGQITRTTTTISGGTTNEILNSQNNFALIRKPVAGGDVETQINKAIETHNINFIRNIELFNSALDSDDYKIDSKVFKIDRHTNYGPSIKKLDFSAEEYDVYTSQTGAATGIKNRASVNHPAAKAYYDDFKRKVDGTNVADDLEMSYFDFRDMFKQLDNFTNKINVDVKTARKNVSNKLVNNIGEFFQVEVKDENGVIHLINFKPTIKNMIRILTEHVHIFLKCIKQVGQDVKTSMDNNSRANQFGGKIQIDNVFDLSLGSSPTCGFGGSTPRPPGTDLNTILPFPDYKEKGLNGYEDKWIGRESPNMPEVDFIKQLVEGLIAAKKKDNELLEDLQFGDDEWYPVNPFDTKILTNYENPWKAFKETNSTDDVVRHMLLRASTFMMYSNSSLSEKEITTMARLEANNAYSNIGTEQVRRAVALFGNQGTPADVANEVFRVANKNVGNENWKNDNFKRNNNGIFKQNKRDINNKIVDTISYVYTSEITDEEPNVILGRKYFLPLINKENTPKFYSGDKLIADGVLDADRIEFRKGDDLEEQDNGDIFFGSFIGGNSKADLPRVDDGSTTIKFISVGDYSNVEQGRYPNYVEDIVDEKLRKAPLDLSTFKANTINEKGLSEYSGIFGGKWKTHEFIEVDIDGSDGTTPVWSQFYANTLESRPSLTSTIRKVENGKTVKKNWDITDEVTGEIKNITLTDGDDILNFMPQRLLKTRNYTSLGETVIPLIQWAKSKKAHTLAIPFLGFHMVRPSADSGLGMLSGPVKTLEVVRKFQNDVGTSQSIDTAFPIFGTDLYYSQKSKEAKAYLFLQTVPWNGLVFTDDDIFKIFSNPFTKEALNYSDCGKAAAAIKGNNCTRGTGLFSKQVQTFFNQRAGFIEAPKAWILMVGSVLWRYRSQTDPVVFEISSYPLIPLSSKAAFEEIKPSKNQYCVPNVGDNQSMGFYYTQNDLLKKIEGWTTASLTLGATKIADFFGDFGAAYVDIERVMTRLPDGVAQQFIDEFLNWVTDDGGFSNISNEYEIFDDSATIDDRINLWLNWNVEMQTDAKTFLANPKLNQNISKNYFTVVRDDSYASFNTLVDIGIGVLLADGSNSPIFLKYEALRKSTTLSYHNKAVAAIATTDINDYGTVFNFNMEMKDSTPAQSELLNFFTDTKIIVNSSWRFWVANNDDDDSAKIDPSFPFYTTEGNYRTYLESFFEEYNKLVLAENEFLSSEEERIKQELFRTIDSDDIYLNLYKSIKSIYDKWIPGTECEIDLCGSATGGECPNLIDTFRFIDRGYNDIGDEMLINPVDMLVELLEDYNISLYDYLARTLADNNFDFIPLPTFINYNSEEEVRDVFKPEPFNTSARASGPQFVCMYIGERSKSLDLGNQSQHSNDGFSVNPDNNCLPIDFTSGSTFIPAFRVAYGDQNQSMFKNFKLDQSEFTETNESLQIFDEMAQAGGPNKSSGVGQNLFNVYNTRSYSAKIESLGNAQIQPFMYFDLDNVPMFTGAYTIISVQHTIKPNHMSTHFTGVRVRKTKTPMVSEATIFMNLIGSLSDVDSEGISLDGLASGPPKVNKGAPAWGGCIVYKINDNDGLKTQSTSRVTPYCVKEVGEFMEYIGNKWHEIAKNEKFTDVLYYNDLSIRGGGDHPEHETHEVGLDIDFRQIRIDKGGVDKTTTISSSSYNRKATIQLMELILDEALKWPNFKSKQNAIITKFYYNDKDVIEHFKKGGVYDTKTGSVYDRKLVFSSPGHNNHMHLKFGLPDRIENDKINGYLICQETLGVSTSNCTRGTSYPDLQLFNKYTSNLLTYQDAATYLKGKYSDSIAKSAFVILAAESSKNKTKKDANDEIIKAFRSAGHFNYGGVQTDSGVWSGKLGDIFTGQYCRKDSKGFRMFAAFPDNNAFMDFLAQKLTDKGFDNANSADHWTERYLNNWTTKNLQTKDPDSYNERFPKKRAIYVSWVARFDNLT